MSHDRSDDASRPRKPGETAPQPGSPPQPPPSARPPAARRPVTPDEAEILHAGAIERLELARLTARKALADPTSLTQERLARLGQDGVARFVVELRQAVLGVGPEPGRSVQAAQARPVDAAKPRVPNGAKAESNTGKFNPGKSGAGQPNATKPDPKAALPKANPRIGRIAGWWQTIHLDDVRIDGTARRWGYVAGLCALMPAVAVILALRL